MLGLRTVVYKVSDLEAAKHWYSKAFQQQPYFDESFYVGFNIGGYELGLDHVKTEVDMKHESVIAYWGVKNIEMTLENLLENGALLHEEVQDVGDGIKVASVKDPWNNIIGIIQNPHFKSE